MEDPWSRKLIAHLIGFSLIIGGGLVGAYLGIALGETIATGKNAFWPFDIHRQYGTDLIHGIPMVLGMSICGALGGYVVFPFLMHVTGLVSRGTVETMLENPRQKRRRPKPKRFD